jgi:multiple sugar transport system permease protein
MSRVWKERWINLGLYVSYVLITLFFMFPIFWIISMSFKTVPELFAIPPKLLPSKFMTLNYSFVLENTDILQSLKNSAQIVVLTCIFTLLIAIPAAYGLSRFKFRLKQASLMSILVCQMISPVVIGVPLYRLFAQLGLFNNYVCLIAVYVAVELPFITWFLKGYLDAIPEDLDEAAIVDGCTKLQILSKIIIPVIIPGIASASILVMVQSWSQFVIPLILLDKSELFPVSVALVHLMATTEGSSTITIHFLAAASVLAIIPVMVVFIVLQRFIVGALTAGAVKG